MAQKHNHANSNMPIPPGFFKVADDRLATVQPGDTLWEPESRQWVLANEHEVGTPVASWKAVIRAIQ